jgi:uncharacterized membrane protein YfcA
LAAGSDLRHSARHVRIGRDLNETVGRLVTLALPALAVGIAVGLVLFGRVPDAGFRRAVLMLLLVTGIGTAIRQPSSAPVTRAIAADQNGFANTLETRDAPARNSQSR